MKQPGINRQQRRAAARLKRPDRLMTVEQAKAANRQRTGSTMTRELIDGYIDPLKKISKSAKEYIDERIKQMHQKFDLPKEIQMERMPMHTSVVVINEPGKTRELLPDKIGQYKILCKGKIAKVMKSQVCMLIRITSAEDGSWAIVPAMPDMANVTTVQEVRKRSFSLLRRYSYEISFNGHVQPAHLFFDYHLRPNITRQKMYVTREYVKVRGKNEDYNDYFRLWYNKPEPESQA